MMTQQFFEFMRKREAIRLAKEAGEPREKWTDDPILAQYKFTNVKREHDWTTRTLMKEFYQCRSSLGRPTELLINCTIARFFGLAETAIEIGWCDGGIERTVERIRETVAARYRRGDAVFTGAYIVPNCGDPRPKHEIVIDIVRSVHEKFGSLDRWFSPELTFMGFIDAVKQLKGFGSFMGKEVILDFCLAGQWEPPDWETWTPVGPGACRGASRVKNADSDPPGSLFPALKERAALEVIRELYATLQNSEPGDLWPADYVSLSLCDIQFQLCEFDKYMRAAREGSRPKSRYVPRVA